MKTVRIKITSSKWFNREGEEKWSLRDKLSQKFKTRRLNIDWEIYKEARNDAQGLMKYKKKKYFYKKLAENKTNLKTLWQTPKSLGSPNKKYSPSNMGLKNKASLLFDSLSIEETFEKYHLSLEENLALKLPKLPYNFGKESVNN